MSTATTDPKPGDGQDLFGPKPVAAAGGDKPAQTGSMTTARVIMPNRTQIELRPMDLESLLPEGHGARLVWAWVERQDLSAMYAAIKVRQGGVGRSAIAPQILLGLWLYATLQGVGSARQLSRLVLEHDAYRWMSGGVQVNHHSLSDFRVAHGAALDELLSASLAALMTAGAVKLECVAQDGVRVRASAGAIAQATDRRRPGARQPAQGCGPAACPARDATAAAKRAGAPARTGGDQAAQRRRGRTGARVEHRRRCQRHEDGRRRLQAGVQHAVRQRL
jgi:transposase